MCCLTAHAGSEFSTITVESGFMFHYDGFSRTPDHAVNCFRDCAKLNDIVACGFDIS